MTFAIMVSVQAAIAQDKNKDTYIDNGDLIEATLYHDNGVVAQEGFYTKNNKLEGDWISYDAQGNKTAVGTYNNGKKVGVWKFYDGNIIKEVSYTDSKIASVTTLEVKDTRVVINNP